MLLDFYELIGVHSGENMADQLFRVTEKYGLNGKVRLHLPLTIMCMY